jgi:putative effector of murein hydrolase
MKVYQGYYVKSITIFLYLSSSVLKLSFRSKNITPCAEAPSVCSSLAKNYKFMYRGYFRTGPLLLVILST